MGGIIENIFRLDQNAIFTRKVDFFVTSGLSILISLGLIFFFLFEKQDASPSNSSILPKLLILQILLNWPHFILSYRLLYKKKSNLRSFPMATIVVPLVLITICIGATTPLFGGAGVMSANLGISYALWIFASLYLAWHYTGQAWGVMIVFCNITNLQFTNIERVILRNGLRTLVLWHIVWGTQSLPKLWIIEWLQAPLAIYAASYLCICAFLLSVTVLIRKAVTEGAIDIRVPGPLIAIYLWYLLLWVSPESFIVVQMAHALQYLIFTARVELNQNVMQSNSRGKLKPVCKTFLIYFFSVVVGLTVFYIPEIYVIAPDGTPTLPALLAIAVNIHHYYTDGAIWKSNSSGVRRDLLHHVDHPNSKRSLN